MPLPISITADGSLSVDLSGHSINIPFSLSGLATLRWILEAQAEWEAKQRNSPTIGFPAAPTQAMADAFLASYKVQVVPPGRTAAQIEDAKRREEERAARARERVAPFAHLDLEIDL